MPRPKHHRYRFLFTYQTNGWDFGFYECKDCGRIRRMSVLRPLRWIMRSNRYQRWVHRAPNVIHWFVDGKWKARRPECLDISRAI